MNEHDEFMMHVARQSAEYSPSLGRKTSCIFVSGSTVLAGGCNDFPPLVKRIQERLERPACYLYLEHAERNAIFDAFRNGTSLKGCTAYLPWFPCVDCARALVGVEISRMVCVEPDWTEEQYHFVDAKNILLESGVQIDYWTKENSPYRNYIR